MEKQCSKCLTAYPATREYWHPGRGIFGLHTYCKLCENARRRRRHRENPEKRKEAKRNYHHRHPERVYAAVARWRKNNPEKAALGFVATNHRRRARLREAAGTFTPADLRELRKLQHGRCGYCGILMTGKGLHQETVDHVIPLSRGGSNAPDNLVLACRSCNARKGRMTGHEFAVKQPSYCGS